MGPSPGSGRKPEGYYDVLRDNASSEPRAKRKQMFSSIDEYPYLPPTNSNLKNPRFVVIKPKTPETPITASKETLKIKTKNKCTMAEAKRLYNQQSSTQINTLSITYSERAKQTSENPPQIPTRNKQISSRSSATNATDQANSQQQKPIIHTHTLPSQSSSSTDVTDDPMCSQILYQSDFSHSASSQFISPLFKFTSPKHDTLTQPHNSKTLHSKSTTLEVTIFSNIESFIQSNLRSDNDGT